MFYLRKSFRAGPVRFNLSKSGLGASVGVTGARIGVSSGRGAYVHAGRSGVYFRRALSGRSSTSPRATSSQSRVVVRVDAGPTEMVEDTGVTYGEDVPRSEMTRLTEDLARPVNKSYMLVPLAAIIGSLLVSGEVGAVIFVGGALVVWPALLVLTVLRRRAGDRYIKTLRKHLSARRPLPDETDREIRETRDRRFLTPAHVNYAQRTAYLDLLDAVVRDGAVEDDERDLIAQIEALFDIDKPFAHRARLDAYRHVHLEAVGDHDLTEQEEEQLDAVRTALGVADDEVAEELAFLDQLREVRVIREGQLPSIDPSKPIQRSEECYFESEGRILKRRILRTFQQDGQKYKIQGLVNDKEGTLLITNKRVLLVHRGTTAIALGKILDVEVDADRQLLTITKDGSVKPVYVTTPEALKAGGIIATLTGC